MKHKLSHLDEKSVPRMVDISEKPVSVRQATAEAVIRFPLEAWRHLAGSGFQSSKGPVMEVARIAGTMALKRTSDLIPFCHPLPIDGCAFEMEADPGNTAIRIQCSVRTAARTGVEMEALQGVTSAALTIYDMTKSLGQGIVISHVRLLSKTGGKEDYQAQ